MTGCRHILLTKPRVKIDFLAAICDFILQPVTSDPFSRYVPTSFLDARGMAQDLRSTTIMEALQTYPNLLSEKEAAVRLGIARITLLRAREAGRIRFFRIATRVLYCEEHLTEFLQSCEKNGRKDHGPGTRTTRHAATRKDHQVSSSRRSVSARETASGCPATESSTAEQGSLPFMASR